MTTISFGTQLTLLGDSLVQMARLYLDTSVIGGYFDPEFSKATRLLFRDLSNGRAIGVVSDLVLVELAQAPQEVRQLIGKLSHIAWEFVEETPESQSHTAAYLRAVVASERFRKDCAHVAVATVCHVDVLVSWNFRHIVRYDRIRAFNAVNAVQGYGPLEIRSPLEVVHHEE